MRNITTWRILAFTFVIISLILSIFLDIIAQGNISNSKMVYAQGFQDGKNQGYKIGYQEGGNIAYQNGYLDGEKEGEQKAQIDAYNKGYSDGENDELILLYEYSQTDNCMLDANGYIHIKFYFF